MTVLMIYLFQRLRLGGFLLLMSLIIPDVVQGDLSGRLEVVGPYVRGVLDGFQGELYRSGARVHGRLSVNLDKWGPSQSLFEPVEKVRRPRGQHLVLRVQDIAGLEAVAKGSHGKGRMRAILHGPMQPRAVNLPVTIYHFDDDSWGVEWDRRVIVSKEAVALPGSSSVQLKMRLQFRLASK